MYVVDTTPPLDVACAAAIDKVARSIEGFHAYTLLRNGGLPGVRPGLSPRSAASRPFTMVVGEWAFPNGLLQTAALMQAIIQSHTYLDANKRTALSSSVFFLSKCQYWLQGLPLAVVHLKELQQLEDLVLRIASEGDDLADRRIAKPYTVEDVALALHEILAPSRNRSLTTMRRGRLAKGAWRTLGGALRGEE